MPSDVYGLRVDTLANWQAAEGNYVPQDGEIVVVSDEYQLVKGDGSDIDTSTGLGYILQHQPKSSSFTPTFTTDGTDFSSISYSTQTGKYIQIGEIVFIAINLFVDSLTAGSASGRLRVGGLPVNCGSVFSPCSIGFAGGFGSGKTPIGTYVRAGASQLSLVYKSDVDGNTRLINAEELTSSSEIQISGFYFV